MVKRESLPSQRQFMAEPYRVSLCQMFVFKLKEVPFSYQHNLFTLKSRTNNKLTTLDLVGLGAIWPQYLIDPHLHGGSFLPDRFKKRTL